jgi:hypothetical protein
MRTNEAYCAARDQQVRIAWPDAPLHPGHAMVAGPPDAVCLELGDRCTGEFCPTFQRPRVELAVRLARSGLDEPGALRVRIAECEGCGRLVELKIVEAAHGWCPECGTVQLLKTSDQEDIEALAGA